MKHLAFVFFLLAATVKFYAQPYSLTAVKGKVKNGYNFWLYTPKDYQAGQKTPVIVFLHGRSLCGNNLNTLGKRSADELMQYNGLGFSKVMAILAAVELGKRRQLAQVEETPDLGTATRIYNYMHPQMMDLQTEEFWAILMNQHYRLIKAVRISHGGITETAVDVRVIMKECVLNNATILAVCHNHPSGNIRPSMQDDGLTKQIKKACDLLRVHFTDHVIITDGSYYSYHEEGLI